VKRYAGTLLFFFISLALHEFIEPLGAEEFPYALSVSASLGLKYGIAGEFVYKNSNDLDKLGQLIWDMKPLFFWGAFLDFSRRDPMEAAGFFIRTDLQAGFPAKSGKAEEGAWTESGAVSLLSIHDNYTNGAWFLDLTTGVSIPIRPRLYLRFYAALNYMKFAWSGEEGYRQTSGSSRLDFYGPVTAYSQTWMIFAGGFSVHYPFLRFFKAALSFQISPLIISIALDDHLFDNFQYIDRIYGGIFLEPRGEFVFSPTRRLDFSLSFSYRTIQASRGYRDTRNIKTDTAATALNEAGASVVLLDTGLSVTLRF
jgi:outer membrane protease